MNHKKRKIILEYLANKKQTTAHNDELKELLGVSYKSIERYLNYLAEEEDLLIIDKSSRAYIYKLIDKDLLAEEISQKDAYDLKVLLEYGTQYMDENTHHLLKKMFSSNKFIEGHLSIFEDLSNKKMIELYSTLLNVIEEHKYVNITFSPNNIYRDAKCIKIVFLDDNWYIAFEYYNEKMKKRFFKLGRISFLKNIEYLDTNKYSNKNTFQTKDIKQYDEFLKNIQNSLTRYGSKKNIAKLMALSNVSQYFEKDMKKFLSSQKYLKTLDDGSVLFSLEYTHDLEILPFIQKWMPNIKILEPNSLIETFKSNIEKSLKQYN
jgi:predicted DNA-binding transcriptional regulator YafY